MLFPWSSSSWFWQRLYESWTIPIAVMLSVPPAILGCFGSQYLRGQQNDVYMQVALIMLIGLAAKNAILIVEYAKMNLERGQDVVTAAINAAHLRLRPILMTSFAFILGCLPVSYCYWCRCRQPCEHGQRRCRWHDLLHFVRRVPDSGHVRGGRKVLQQKAETNSASADPASETKVETISEN
jgi:hypothetical protein